MQMLTNNVNKGDNSRPKNSKWVEQFFVSYDKCQKTIVDLRNSIYDYDIKVIHGTHGEEYILSVEIDRDTELDGFLDDAFEGYYDD